MKLRVGILENSQKLFSGTIRFLLGAKSGKLWASYSGKTFKQIDVPIFGTSDINDISYGPDLSVPTVVPDNVSTGNIWNETYTGAFANNTYYLSTDYGNGIWLLSNVYQGTQGQMFTSTDAITWTTISNFSNSIIQNVAYGNGLWVASSTAKEIFTSTDIVNWTTRVSNFTGNIYEILYANNIWVAVGEYAQMRRSTDAITWTTSTNFFTGQIIGLGYGNGTWLAGGDNAQMRRSTDAITWVTVINPNAVGFTQINSLVYGNGLWLTSMNQYLSISTDTITWTTVGQPSTFFVENRYYKSVAYGKNLWVVVGNTLPKAYKSTDALTWEKVISTQDFPNLQEITYNNDIWFIGSYNNTNYYSNQLYKNEYNSNSFFAADSSGKTAKSTDGFTWTTINSEIPITDNVKIISSKTKTSSPFSIWTTCNIPVDESTITNTLSYSAIYAQNKWAVFGSKSFISTDAISWSPILTDTTYCSSHFNNNLWVVGGYGIIKTSTDAVTWVSRTSNFGNNRRARSIFYGNGLWSAAGSYGQLRTSTDAVTWVTQNSNFGNTSITSIAYGQGIWIAGGYAGQLRTSTDAVTWVTRTSGFSTEAIASIVYGNGIWTAGGNSGQIRTSTDAITWISRSSNLTFSVSLFYSSEQGIWFAATADSQIRVSNDTLSWTTLYNMYPSQNLNFVIFANGLCIVGGSQQRIFKSSKNSLTSKIPLIAGIN